MSNVQCPIRALCRLRDSTKVLAFACTSGDLGKTTLHVATCA